MQSTASLPIELTN